jgi:AraC family transcriptional regulator, transcriptional activator of pobA
MFQTWDPYIVAIATISRALRDDGTVGAVRPRLYDPRNGGQAVACERIDWRVRPQVPERTNCFSVYWIDSGAASMTVDLAEHRAAAGTLVFLSPYRRVRVIPTRRVRGAVIRFHANFLCVETFHAESGCSGVLFNDPFGSPLVQVPKDARTDVRALVERIAAELVTPREGHQEVVISSLKILLVLATRLKNASRRSGPTVSSDHRHPLLQRLSEAVEEHYRELHGPAEYAALLNVTPKTLARFTRTRLGRTMTDVVRERILIEAKWELLHTLTPVKQIAAELGFSDELYFSRFFKKATGRSPIAFREFETGIRGGSNLAGTLVRPVMQIPGGE